LVCRCCDGSLLLDNSTTIMSEKDSNPNKNSICGLELTEEIKVVLEHACPGASGPNGWLSVVEREQQPHVRIGWEV
jgi:peroxidase